MLSPGKGVLIVYLHGYISYASTFLLPPDGHRLRKIKGMSCFDFVFPEDMKHGRCRRDGMFGNPLVPAPSCYLSFS